MKRIIIILLLLAVPVFGATLYPSQDATMNWTANEWSLADDNAKDHVPPIDDDSVIFTQNSSATITLDADQIDIELAGFDMQVGNPGTGYAGTFAMGANNLDVDGACVLAGTITGTGKIECSGNFTTRSALDAALPSTLTIELNGTGTSLTVSTGGGALVINTAGTITLANDNYFDSYTQTQASTAFIGTGHTLYASGHVVYTAGVVTNLSVVQSGTANLDWSSTSYPLLDYQTAASAVITLTGWSYAKAVTLNDSSTLAGSSYALQARNPAANDFYDCGTATVSAQITILLDNYRSNSGTLKSSTKITIASGNDKTLTQSGLISSPTATNIYSTIDNTYAWLILGITSSDLGVVVLGLNTSVRAGRLDLANGAYAVTIASVAAGYSGQANQLDFGDAVITLSGTINGTDITCTTDASGTHPIIHGGTVQNVDMPLDDEALDCTDNVADGGSNVNCWMPSVMGVHSVIGGGMIGSGEAH